MESTNFEVDNAFVEIAMMSMVRLKSASIYFGEKSQVNLQFAYFSMISNINKETNILSVDTSVHLYISFSQISISEGSRLLLKFDSNFRILDSRFEMQCGNIVAGKLTEVFVFEATMEIGKLSSYFVEESEPKATLKLDGTAKIHVSDNSKLILIKGEIIMKYNSKLELKDVSKVVVYGLLEFGQNVEILLTSGRIMEVGFPTCPLCRKELYTIVNELKPSNLTSLLILSKLEIPKELIVNEGAHCYSKPLVSSAKKFKNAIVILDADSETNEFKCFGSRQELMQSLNRTYTE